jgi:hypothetical protein
MVRRPEPPAGPGPLAPEARPCPAAPAPPGGPGLRPGLHPPGGLWPGGSGVQHQAGPGEGAAAEGRVEGRGGGGGPAAGRPAGRRVAGDRHPLSWTPLHLAAVSRQAEVAAVLLEWGADPDEEDDFQTVHRPGGARRQGVGVQRRAQRPGQLPGLHRAALRRPHREPRGDGGPVAGRGRPAVDQRLRHTPGDYAGSRAARELLAAHTERLEKRREREERRRFPLEQRRREVMVGRMSSCR